MRENNSNNHIYDYIVAGMGISGLQSMEVLTRKTRNIIALESQDHPAGRIESQSVISVTSLPGARECDWVQKNYDKLKDAYIEKGATWIEEQHQFLLKIFKKFNIQIREQHSEGDNIYLHKDTPLTVT